MSDRRRTLQRLEISRAAIRLFREDGVAATGGEQIAEAVGLSARTFWRWFRTKESCVEPVLSLATDAFTASLARWPDDTPLAEHLSRDYTEHPDAGPDDGDLVLAVIRLSRSEPALRAIWLVVQERAEPVLAGILAGRFGRDPDDVAVRVQAAALNGALRVATEDIAAATADGRRPPAAQLRERLSTAVDAATHGVDGERGPGQGRTRST
ncbi:TetR/AcrR family transcriptional regulator [Pseudonocardia sp. ICBG1293]|uniref:TetR/AcrR family transcriptional regulator n=1 Tax=Pseudonocardia sp. ICBG1293 TaxID=2844382 RepID=UPI001CCF3B9D|nr:TetR/AcrR family transcriptional regulator [Pseudonocardia sp. ICBG1293]